MKRLYLYDDATARQFEPFVLTRPVSELRAGAEIIRARWERVTGTKCYGFIGAPHLADFDELDAPPGVAGEDTIPAGSVIANSRCAISLNAKLDDTSAVFAVDGDICAVRIRSSIRMSDFADGSATLDSLTDSSVSATEIQGAWLGEVWDLIGTLAPLLTDDIPAIGSTLSGAAIENATVIGRFPIYCETGADIEPYVILDASEGPILIRRGATIASFTRIVGPCYIGEESHIVGNAIRGCSIGNACKVQGEIAGSVMLGHSNKGHTGFVGSSYIGRWVNLGAGTTTSNLKNTYGPVHLWTPSGMRDTGLQFLGSMIGDHAKTGIGTLLTTGCVVGAGANIYGAQSSSKYVPPFSWGDHEPYEKFEHTKFIVVVERMMARRHMSMSAKQKHQLESVCIACGEPH